MMKGGALAIVIFLGAAPAGLAAKTLPIDGVFGDAVSCELHRTGEYSERGDKLVLSADGLLSMMWACSFEHIEKKGNVTSLKLACSSEGSGPEDDYKDEAELTGDAQSGFMVTFKDGGKWGPMKRC
ncbi:hypothetical protein ABID20_001833 [Rhizobium alvei]